MLKLISSLLVFLISVVLLDFASGLPYNDKLEEKNLFEGEKQPLTRLIRDINDNIRENDSDLVSQHTTSKGVTKPQLESRFGHHFRGGREYALPGNFGLTPYDNFRPGPYGPPHGNFGPPHGNFGPPHGNFGPPNSNFGPPPRHNHHHHGHQWPGEWNGYDQGFGHTPQHGYPHYHQHNGGFQCEHKFKGSNSKPTYPGNTQTVTKTPFVSDENQGYTYGPNLAKTKAPVVSKKNQGNNLGNTVKFIPVVEIQDTTSPFPDIDIRFQNDNKNNTSVIF